jgi:RES domain-containing protein
MRIWRIARRNFQKLDGEGARLHGGRWSPEGTPVVYASSTLALAALEYLVNVDIEDVPDDLVALEVEVPDDTSTEETHVSDLPRGWNQVEEHPACIIRGSDWVTAGDALVLRVPSALIPTEQNILLNPRHPEMARVRLVSSRDFAFDPRLL